MKLRGHSIPDKGQKRTPGSQFHTYKEIGRRMLTPETKYLLKITEKLAVGLA